MVAIPLDKTNCNKVSKYANVLIFKEFYPKTKNVSYYLKWSNYTWRKPNNNVGHENAFDVSVGDKKVTSLLDAF